MTGPSPSDPTRGGLYCGAKKRQSEGHCAYRAGWGTEHLGVGNCRKHGGNTRSHVAAAAAEVARRAVLTYGLPRDVPPRQAVLEEVARTAGHVAWLGDRVAELETDDLVWGEVKRDTVEVSPNPGTNTTHAARVNVWVELYQRERRHLVDVCKTAEVLKIADREVELARQHGQLIADVLRAVLGDPELGLTAEQRRAVPAVARRHLSVVA